MVPRGKASQVALGRGGNWTAGEEKGGASFWGASRGRDRLLWAFFPYRPLRVPCLARERADKKVVEAGGGPLALASRNRGRRRVRWTSGSRGRGYLQNGQRN